MSTRTFLALPLLAAVLAAGCGSDDDPPGAGASGGGDRGAATGGPGRCVDAWNKASPDVRARASLSHRGEGGEADVQVGSYAGEPFEAAGEAYDASGSQTSADVAIAPGDCVAVDLTGTGDSETNWVMVNAKGAPGVAAGWYFLDDAGSHPLAKAPQQLRETVRARLAGFGTEARLQPDAP